MSSYRSYVARKPNLAPSLSYNLGVSREISVILINEMLQKHGYDAVTFLLSVDSWVLKDWASNTGNGERKVPMRARDRKLIWLVHSLLFNPELVSSPFHIATFGRFHTGSYQLKGVKLKRRRRPKRGKSGTEAE